jgi:hypothetical protein
MNGTTATRPVHPDLEVAHAVPGRVRLRVAGGRRSPAHVQEVARQLAAVDGVHRVQTNPATGNITVHYHHPALQSMKFLAEVAGAFGMVAVGIEPEQIESMFGLVGIHPDGDEAGDWSKKILPAAFFLMGFLAGRRSG